MYKIIPIPRTINAETMHALCDTGINMFRFNFSHITPDIADEALKYIDKPIQILQDLQGHKLRVGDIPTEIFVPAYTKFTFVPDKILFTEKFSTNIVIPLAFDSYESLKHTKKFIIEVRNQYIDINILNEQEKQSHTCFQCMSDKDFIIRKGKGIMPVGINRNKMTLSNKDKDDILWGIKNNANAIVYSFASREEQIFELKYYIETINNAANPLIWAKIECQEGIDNIEPILNVSDGIMIGRGDLSAQYKPFEIAKIQNDIIRLCKEKNKPCIIATHVFDNYKQTQSPNLSDVTAMYCLAEKGASGFMLANEFLFAKNQISLVKDFSSICDLLIN